MHVELDAKVLVVAYILYKIVYSSRNIGISTLGTMKLPNELLLRRELRYYVLRRAVLSRLGWILPEE